MAKRLIIVRHGKSDQVQNGLSDFDRTLNNRGHNTAQEMAERISLKGIVPELIVSSPAIRAFSTAKHFADVYAVSYNEIRQELSVYEANTIALLNVVNKLDNRYNIVALFGHNPGLTEFVNYLADTKIYDLPTASVSVIDFSFDDWSLLSLHTGSLFLFDYPKNAEDH